MAETIKTKVLSGRLETKDHVQVQTLFFLLKCHKEYCKQKYIIVTQQEFCDRIYQHIGYVRNKQLNKAT